MAKAVSILDIVEKAGQTQAITDRKLGAIGAVSHRLKILALNAMIEAERAGAAGKGFAVVADEVRGISGEVEGLTAALKAELGGQIAGLESLAREMADVAQGQRLVDLALNAVELIDRNLYERTCDVRWWATDAAAVQALAEPAPALAAEASRRLAVILSAYTVYLDIWLCDLAGRVVASGRPERFAVEDLDVADRPWFARAVGLRSGSEYAVADIATDTALSGAQIATYSAGVREGGEEHGRLLGVLAIHFDWKPQASAIVTGVRLADGEQERTRVLLLDSTGRVLAASDGHGLLSERLALSTGGRQAGFYAGAQGELIAFHRTPGYETYEGLGWHGVIVQTPRRG